MDITDKTNPIMVDGQQMRIVKPRNTVVLDGRVLGAGTIINWGGGYVSPVSASVDTPSHQPSPLLSEEI